MPGAPSSGPRPAPEPALTPNWNADPAGWHESLDYLFGVDLFNAGFCWESHEALEVVWKQLRAADQTLAATFVQSIIQVAAARLKRETGEEVGVARLHSRAASNIAPALSTHTPIMGVDAEAWWPECETWFASAGRNADPPNLTLRTPPPQA
ncbi:MAG: DUF309 domain-containing protein [Phycisphaerales bacterium]